MSGRPVIVAIDGRSNNGKTSLAARIGKAVPGCVVIHTDDIAWEHSRFGWADLLIDGILGPVHRGEAVSYRPPRWARAGRRGERADVIVCGTPEIPCDPSTEIVVAPPPRPRG